MKTVYADHHANTLDKDGIADFCWPILHKDMSSFGEDMMHACADLLREWPDQAEAQIYKFISKNYVAVAAGIFQADLLLQESKKQDLDIRVPDEWLIWPYTLKGQPPPPPLFLKAFCRQRASSPVYKRLFDFKRIRRLFKKIDLKNGLNIEGLKIGALSREILDRAIVATQRTHLICRQASVEGKDVYLFRSDRWFQPVEDQDVPHRHDLNTLEKNLLEIVHKLYLGRNVSQSSWVAGYLEKFLVTGADLAVIHYRRLLARDDLPTHIWTGTGGQIWDLMLRSAVIHKGGEAAGFDHGGGTSHASLALVGFVELWACHEFYTFNERQRIDIEAAAQQWPRLDNVIPTVKSVPPGNAPAIRDKANVGGKKVYFLSTLYDQDRGRSFAFYSDLAYVDWQTRAIHKLVSWGYKVYFKPHPESRTQWPKYFEKINGVEVVQENFESVLEDADLLLIDYTYTSIMYPAFLSNIPIVLVDFDDVPWHAEAKALVQKRANLVEGSFDKNNRVSINWDNLHLALMTAADKRNNHEYVQAYYV